MWWGLDPETSSGWRVCGAI